MILKRISVFLLTVILCACSTTLAIVDYDDMYVRRSYAISRYRYYEPQWNPIPYYPFYYQSPNIIIRPYHHPSYPSQPNKPGIEGGRSNSHRPQMRRGTRQN